MNFRNILFAISTIMIMFCLTLYFQSGTQLENNNYDQYKNLQYNESRSHQLQEFNQKIAPYELEEVIAEILEKNKFAGEKTRVMEIGFGNGRVLMELKKRFPEVEFYGINKEKTLTFYRRESFILTALKFNIMTKEEAENSLLPYVVFQDLDFGHKIPYDDNKFDLVFSQGVIPHIRYTFELFNEILRILKKDGLSFHTDVTGVNIFSDGLQISMKEAAIEFRKRGIDVYILDQQQSIRFKKTTIGASFPVTPHQAIPAQTIDLTSELKRPEMSYSLNP